MKQKKIKLGLQGQKEVTIEWAKGFKAGLIQAKRILFISFADFHTVIENEIKSFKEQTK